MGKPELEIIDGGPELLDINEVSDQIGKLATEVLGVSADSAYVTHHDVARAARLGAKMALEFYWQHPPVGVQE